MDNGRTEERLLTPGEVAEILQCSKATAYGLLQRGEITTIRIGRLVRVKRADLDIYIQKERGWSGSSSQPQT